MSSLPHSVFIIYIPKVNDISGKTMNIRQRRVGR